jgi:hypothetical protein
MSCWEAGKMDNGMKSVLHERFEISNLEKKLGVVRETLSFLGFDTENRFKAFPHLNAVYSLYRGATPDFMGKESGPITTFSQLEKYVKKYLGENVRIGYEAVRHTMKG